MIMVEEVQQSLLGQGAWVTQHLGPGSVSGTGGCSMVLSRIFAMRPRPCNALPLGQHAWCVKVCKMVCPLMWDDALLWLGQLPCAQEGCTLPGLRLMVPLPGDLRLRAYLVAGSVRQDPASTAS